MQKGTLFLLGTLLVLAGIWTATPESNIGDVINTNTRKLASLLGGETEKNISVEEQMRAQVKVLTSYTPSKHIRVYKESFNPTK